MTDGTIEADVTGTVKEDENLWRRKKTVSSYRRRRSLEEMFAELDLLAEKLENRDTSLEDSFILYRQAWNF